MITYEECQGNGPWDRRRSRSSPGDPKRLTCPRLRVHQLWESGLVDESLLGELGRIEPGGTEPDRIHHTEVLVPVQMGEVEHDCPTSMADEMCRIRHSIDSQFL